MAIVLIQEKTAVCLAKVKECRYTELVGKSGVMVVCMETNILTNNMRISCFVNSHL